MIEGKRSLLEGKRIPSRRKTIPSRRKTIPSVEGKVRRETIPSVEGKRFLLQKESCSFYRSGLFLLDGIGVLEHGILL